MRALRIDLAHHPYRGDAPRVRALHRRTMSFTTGYRMRHARSASLSLATLLIVFPAVALAAPAGGGGGGMPWESAFSKVFDSIQSMAPILASIAFLIAGIIWMFGESGGMSRKAVGILVGGALVFGASSLATKLFDGGVGLTF